MSVLLKCVKVGGRLRVHITSPEYFTDHYCQFPKAIRVENAVYQVPLSDVAFVMQTSRGAFYRIKRNNIRIVSNDSPTTTTATAPVRRVFQDEAENDCAICLSEPKHYIFGPCGHFYVCRSCADQLALCPICRSYITSKADFRMLQN